MRTINLCYGMGEEGKSHCVMAATSIVAGEPFSDEPTCVGMSITNSLIVTNDFCPSDRSRNELLGHLPWLIIGTNGGIEPEKERADLFAEYSGYRKPKEWTTDEIGECARHAARFAFQKAALESFGKTFFTGYTLDDATDKAYKTWFGRMREFIEFIEEKIIPVYTTMPVEPGYRMDKLVCQEVEA